jgi:DNA (cytosine-5)-methyltransferase 1
MSRPRLLDLFCGGGGAAMGYVRAGFDVVGVDNRPQPHFPFAFVQADALEYLADHGREYDAIHASPPCQAYSIMRNLPWLRDRKYPELIDPTRELLAATGRPWVIENVMGARLEAMWLCGTMFGLPFYRHRAFLSSIMWLAPGHPVHRGVIRSGRLFGSRGTAVVYGRELYRRRQDGERERGAGGVQLIREVMGINWMTRDELSQAIPPAYTEHVGHFLRQAVEG